MDDDKLEIDVTSLRSVMVNRGHELGFVCITEWQNCLGFDVNIQGGDPGDDSGRIGLSWEQWKLLRKAVKRLDSDVS